MKKIRTYLALFVLLLALSGFTAFPLRHEMAFLAAHHSVFPTIMQGWIAEVNTAIEQTPELVLYGTDWLAFAHLVIALFFIPVFIDPVRHRANLLTGMAACMAVLPLAFICGHLRQIPVFHQLIDCSFGVGGVLLLYYINRLVLGLERRTA